MKYTPARGRRLESLNLLAIGCADSGSVQVCRGRRPSSDNFTETGSAAALTPHASLGWQHAFGDVNSSASLAFVSGRSVFTVAGVPIARDAALVGAGVDYAFSKSVSASVTYSGQFGSGTEDNAFKGTINIKF